MKKKRDATITTLGGAFIVHCGKCSHEWTVAYLPMPLDDFCSIASAAICPKCASKKVFCGPNPPKEKKKNAAIR